MAKQPKKTVFRLVDECFKAQVWCFKHGYKIYPVVDEGKYRITIERGGAIKKGDHLYSINNKEWADKVFELYLKLYLAGQKKGL